jgi:hypothetical protein
MVGMMQTFGNCEIQTPHGGPPFQGWRKGFGFGHSVGSGGHVLHPSHTQELRFTPGGDRGLASNSFWRKKWEMGKASSFGIGDRPEYGNARDADICANTYGDVAPILSKVRKNPTKSGIKLKPRFPTFEEKKRDDSWPMGGPGPGKYDTCNQTGESSLSNPSKVPSWSLGPRILANDLKEAMSKPAPNAYVVWTKPGKNSPVLRGTLYDISMKGRAKPQALSEQSPGPARYSILGELEGKYTLASQVASVKVPKKQGGSFEASTDDFLQDLDEAGSVSGDEEIGHQSLTRVESAPM